MTNTTPTPTKKSNPLEGVPTLPNNPDIPVIEEWVNLVEAAELLGQTRQYTHKRARLGGFHSLHRIGNIGQFFVVAREEIQEIVTRRAARETQRENSSQES